MIINIGVDIIGIDRFRTLENESDFIEQIFSLRELSRIPNNNRKPVYIATFFTIKEAVLKAFGLGLTKGSFWREIELLDDGKINLNGNLKEYAEKLQVSKIHSSYSYSNNYVTAFVLLEKLMENS